MSKKIETDWQTFVKFWSVPLIIAGVLFFLYKAVTGLVIVGISIFLALALKPLVRNVNNFFIKCFGAEKRHRTVSAVMAYLIVVITIGGIIAVIGPVVVNETAKFVQNFPEMFEKNFGGWEGVNNFGRTIGVEDLHSKISSAITGISNDLLGFLSNNLISGVSGVANTVMQIILVLVLTLLFLLEGPGILKSFWNRLGAIEERKSVKVAQRITSRMANVVSTYVSRQTIVAALDGCASTSIVFILALIFGLSPSLAIPMGMITMLFYLIPMFGQFIGGTLVTLLLLFSNPVAALVFAIVYIVYAQIENNLIAPKIQGNALNLSAVIILSAIVVGMYTLGLLGAIIAVPIAGCIRVLVEEYTNIKSIRE